MNGTDAVEGDWERTGRAGGREFSLAVVIGGTCGRPRRGQLRGVRVGERSACFVAPAHHNLPVWPRRVCTPGGLVPERDGVLGRRV